MKTLLRKSIHEDYRSHDCLVCDIQGKKVKITYEAYNAIEKCNIELFDGFRWNLLFTLLDMGIVPELSAYNIWDKERRRTRADYLFKEAEEMVRSIL